MTFIQQNANKIIANLAKLSLIGWINLLKKIITTCSILVVLLCALYFIPIVDYLIFGLKYLPGYTYNPDTTRNAIEIIESRGFIGEEHHILTEDGYILTLHRIIHPHADRSRLKPILLQHGFQNSGSAWIINANGTLNADGEYVEENTEGGVGNALGFVLASRGYDVWLANMRGNVFSSSHTYLDSRDPKFWEFSINEMIDYDFPAIINYMLTTTEKKTISYIGHSQGTIMMFGLLASKPEYTSIVKPFIAVSPVSFLGNATSPLKMMRFVEPFFRSIPTSFLHLGKVQKFYAQFCENYYMQTICQRIFYILMGFHENQFDFSRIGPFFATLPSGSSSWGAAHLLQKFKSKRPTKFNYGSDGENIKRYGVNEPPEYQLSSIRSPYIALIYAANDWLNDINDINLLKQHLKLPLLDDYLVPDLRWNHNELIWGKEVGKYVNTRILSILDKC